MSRIEAGERIPSLQILRQRRRRTPARLYRHALGRAEEAAALAMEISGALAGTSPEDAGRSYGLLAATYEQIGDRARSREPYELAAALLEQNPNRYLVQVYDRPAWLLEEEGRRDEALDVLKRAVRLRVRIGLTVSGDA